VRKNIKVKLCHFILFLELVYIIVIFLNKQWESLICFNNKIFYVIIPQPILKFVS